MYVPHTRPEMGRHAAEELLVASGCDDAVALLGRRGYYRDTMGDAGVQERGIYDDAILLVSPTAFASFNANCDPSRHGGALAVLQPGIWRYKLGTHHPNSPNAYPCLVQAGPVTVRRDNGLRESGEFYIHIHRGGYRTTSSEGCQTIFPDQWDEFFALVQGEMRRHGLVTIPYCLTERAAVPSPLPSSRSVR